MPVRKHESGHQTITKAERCYFAKFKRVHTERCSIDLQPYSTLSQQCRAVMHLQYCKCPAELHDYTQCCWKTLIQQQCSHMCSQMPAPRDQRHSHSGTEQALQQWHRNIVDQQWHSNVASVHTHKCVYSYCLHCISE